MLASLFFETPVKEINLCYKRIICEFSIMNAKFALYFDHCAFFVGLLRNKLRFDCSSGFISIKHTQFSGCLPKKENLPAC